VNVKNDAFTPATAPADRTRSEVFSTLARSGPYVVCRRPFEVAGSIVSTLTTQGPRVVVLI